MKVFRKMLNEKKKKTVEAGEMSVFKRSAWSTVLRTGI